MFFSFVTAVVILAHEKSVLEMLRVLSQENK